MSKQAFIAMCAAALVGILWVLGTALLGFSSVTVGGLLVGAGFAIVTGAFAQLGARLLGFSITHTGGFALMSTVVSALVFTVLISLGGTTLSGEELLAGYIGIVVWGFLIGAASSQAVKSLC